MDIKNYIEKINQCANQIELRQIQTELFGKNGAITSEMKKFGSSCGSMSIEEKKEHGAKINQIKAKLNEAIEGKIESFANIINPQDCSYLPKADLGMKHVIQSTIDKLHIFFSANGFKFEDGPDIEECFYNFDALNISPHHPARNLNDTFYINDDKLLRTHVTAVQIRLLEKTYKENLENCELRAYSIGCVFRNDTVDATHTPAFHQIEGIVVESGVTLAHLKGFFEKLCASMFETKLNIRLRPSYFPFTEPSCEIDIFYNGKWLEIGGCGIIHSSILQKFGREDQQSIAFGLGLERIIMIKHNMRNINDLYNNQISVLKNLQA